MLASNKSEFTLSVVVPVSRMAGRLDTLESWLTDLYNFRDVQVIFVHDIQDTLTSDELKQIVNKINPEQCILIEQTVNSPGLARNIGKLRADGIWVLFADSDDKLNLPSLLPTLRTQLESNFDALIFNYESLDSKTGNTISHPHDSKAFKVGWNPGIWRWAFRKKIISNLKFTNHRMGEDQLFLMEFSSQTHKIGYQKATSYTYVTGNDFQLTNSLEAINEIHNLLNEVLALRCKHTNREPISEVMFLHLLISCLKHPKSKLLHQIKTTLKIIFSEKTRINIGSILLSLKSETYE